MTEVQIISDECLEIVDSIYSDLLDVEDTSNLTEFERIINGLPETNDDKDDVIDSLEEDDEKESIREKLIEFAEKQ